MSVPLAFKAVAIARNARPCARRRGYFVRARSIGKTAKPPAGGTPEDRPVTEQAASTGGPLGVGLHLCRRKGYLVDTSSTVKVRGPTRAAVEENASPKRLLIKMNRF